MSFLVCVTHRHRVTLFVLSNRSCDWCDLLTKGYVNHIYIYISDKPHIWAFSHQNPTDMQVIWSYWAIVVVIDVIYSLRDMLIISCIYIHIYIYIYIYQTSHTLGHSHIKTPLKCKSYDLDADWVVESEVWLIQFSKCCLQNLLFSLIHMWLIEFNENMSGIYWYERFLKHCQT